MFTCYAKKKVKNGDTRFSTAAFYIFAKNKCNFLIGAFILNCYYKVDIATLARGQVG